MVWFWGGFTLEFACIFYFLHILVFDITAVHFFGGGVEPVNRFVPLTDLKSWFSIRESLCSSNWFDVLVLHDRFSLNPLHQLIRLFGLRFLLLFALQLSLRQALLLLVGTWSLWVLLNGSPYYRHFTDASIQYNTFITLLTCIRAAFKRNIAITMSDIYACM